MKITIPEEYRHKFESQKMWLKPKGGGECITHDLTHVYALRWKKGSVLVTNKKMLDAMGGVNAKALEMGEDYAQFMRLILAGVEELIMDEDGTVELPDYLAGWLGEGELTYEKDDYGLVVKAKNLKKS